ncbi:MAG: tRNA (adenosine(37)-N6)-threonylcarbamoyltransferase complex ATPase subunit type 1 TsaE [Clostridia bacterium]|nr:tRNA (adenosine(37)-N6)-threonylcarbamoyltransferase complex ATPase subunit type 1 TsaE [Clostridia bacterium]
MEIITNNNLETQKIGMLLGQYAFLGMVIALKGEVGAGKTELAKGFAQGINCEEATSPTFSIMNVYENGRLPVYHFDFYRAGGDIDEFEEYIFGEGAALIEWSENIDLPNEVLTVEIIKIDENKRKLIFNAGNKLYEDIIGRIENEYTCS